MFELYVSRDHLRPTQYDAGSLLCIQLASENLAELVEILEVFPASKKLPNWLIGTPTLHDSTSGEVLTGYQAIRFLQQLTIEVAENRGETRATTQKKRVSGETGGGALLQKKTPSVQGGGAQYDVEDEGGVDTDHLWETCIEECGEGEEIEEGMGGRKLKGDDLSKAIQERQVHSHTPHNPGSGGEAQPPPPPPLDG
jgi:hypothetical protein